MNNVITFPTAIPASRRIAQTVNAITPIGKTVQHKTYGWFGKIVMTTDDGLYLVEIEGALVPVVFPVEPKFLKIEA